MTDYEKQFIADSVYVLAKHLEAISYNTLMTNSKLDLTKETFALLKQKYLDQTSLLKMYTDLYLPEKEK